MNTPDLVNEILLKVQALIMKSIMKALNILNETAQHQLWNIQWKDTALIMKNIMKAPNIPNKIFNERIQH